MAELLGPGTLLPWEGSLCAESTNELICETVSLGSSVGACGTLPSLLLWDGRQDSSCWASGTLKGLWVTRALMYSLERALVQRQDRRQEMLRKDCCCSSHSERANASSAGGLRAALGSSVSSVSLLLGRGDVGVCLVQSCVGVELPRVPPRWLPASS